MVRMALLFMFLSAPMVTAAGGLTLAWEAKGLRAPESAVYDAARDVIYVSNIGGDPSAKDGDGSIARLSPDGRVLDADWVRGLNAPKGLALYKDRLYVADLDTVVEIDVTTERILRRYRSDTARFLNDAAVDGQGVVYSSDMQDAAIYRLKGGKLEKWLASDTHALCSPNGIYAAKDHLVVGCWTEVVDEFDTVAAGRLKAVDYDTRQISVLGTGKPIGHIDGLEADGKDGWYITDWLAGKLLHVDEKGAVTTLLAPGQGNADLGIDRRHRLLLIPMMNDDAVRAYRMP